MGQYYKPLNETKGEFLYSHSYNNGLKLMEHSYLDNDFVCAVEALIGPGGAWEGDVVRWEGDYADGVLELEGKNRYQVATETYSEVHPIPLEQSRRYVVNHTKKEFLDTEGQRAEEFSIHPFPLLICNGNGRGGGDYCGTCPTYVGAWCGDLVTTSDTVPEDYQKCAAVFREAR